MIKFNTIIKILKFFNLLRLKKQGGVLLFEEENPNCSVGMQR